MNREMCLEEAKKQESWKPVLGYEWCLEVSNTGKVRSIDRLVQIQNGIHQYNRFFKGIELKQTRNPQTGYMQIGAPRGKHLTVHRIVAAAFIPNPKNLPQVNHKNFDRADNRVENLEWCTNGENVRHSMRSGDNRSLTPVISLTTGARFKSEKDAAKAVGGDPANVSRSCRTLGKVPVAGERFVYTTLESENPKMYQELRAKYENAPTTKSESLRQASYKRMKPVIAMVNAVPVARYESVAQAAVATKCHRPNISKVLKGKRKSAGGYQWKYAACGCECATGREP